MLDKVEYLGTTIPAAGISPTGEKVQAIKDAAPPTYVSELVIPWISQFST